MVWVCVFGSMDLVRVNRGWRWVCSSVGFFFFFFKMGLVIGGSGLMVLVLVLVVLMVVWV